VKQEQRERGEQEHCRHRPQEVEHLDTEFHDVWHQSKEATSAHAAQNDERERQLLRCHK
jgi:hypothetical protein